MLNRRILATSAVVSNASVVGEVLFTLATSSAHLPFTHNAYTVGDLVYGHLVFTDLLRMRKHFCSIDNRLERVYKYSSSHLFTDFVGYLDRNPVL